jgi:hypothetical protein
MATQFFTRSEKAQLGFACNQKADGSLWAGKGYECPLAEQIDRVTAEAVAAALRECRGDRMGHFWINLAKRIVTMQVGLSVDNHVVQGPF